MARTSRVKWKDVKCAFQIQPETVSGLWASQWKLTRLPPWELGVMTEVQDS